jgi:nucleotide-binding universal stress UspA family protein
MKSLLVHMDGTLRCKARLQIADTVATRHEAHLTALFAVTPPSLELPFSLLSDGTELALMRDIHDNWRNQAVETFKAVATTASPVWAELKAWPACAGFAGQALFADLMVLGQRDREDQAFQVPPDFVPAVMIESGRPALVIPQVGDFSSVGQRVLVAWKPSPSSARALTAALPFLRTASHVNVVEWGSPQDNCKGEPLDVQTYLGAHGVKATFHREAAEPHDIGEQLLSCAADESADLLVMGCYGHSRARELILGGATRTILQSMTLPVLMSH